MNDCWHLITRLVQETLGGAPLTEAYATAILQRIDRWAGAGTTSASVAHLPLLTCRAVGGTSERAVPVLAAWQMLHIAAKLFDDIEDGDADDPAADLNLATGVLTTVPLLLATLDAPLAEIQQLTQAAQRAVLVAGAGQHADLLAGRVDAAASDPDRWLTIARAKSGALLGWAAWAGALVGGAAPATLDQARSYGEHLGVLLQIADDFVGIWRPERMSDLTARRLSLPVCYALSVVAPEDRAALSTLLDRASDDAHSQSAARQRLIELGAQVYMAVTARIFQQHALAALREIELDHELGQPLVALVEDVFPRLAPLNQT